MSKDVGYRLEFIKVHQSWKDSYSNSKLDTVRRSRYSMKISLLILLVYSLPHIFGLVEYETNKLLCTGTIKQLYDFMNNRK